MQRGKMGEHGPFVAWGLTSRGTDGLVVRSRPVIGLVVLALIVVIAIGGRAAVRDEEAPALHEFGIIVERNIFSARRNTDTTEPRTDRQTPSTSATAAAVNVVGTVKTDDRRSCIAILQIEGRHVLCRIGETVAGMRLTEIRPSAVVFESPDGRQVARIEPGVVRNSAVATAPPPAADEPLGARPHRHWPISRRLPLGPAGMGGLASKLPLAAHVQDGRGMGLRLTRDVMGLKQDDRLTQVGSQSLRGERPKQRLWQMVSKYRQSGAAVPEIPVIIERGNSQFELILLPSS